MGSKVKALALHTHILEHMHRVSWADLGSEVLRSAAEGPSCVPTINLLLAESEVCDFDMALLVQQQVLQLGGTN